MSRFSRRSFLAAGGATILAACGGGSGSSSKGTAGFQVAARWSNDHVLVPGVQRLAVSIARDGALLTEGPERLQGVIRDGSGKEVLSLQAVRRSQGIVVPYWDFRSNLSAPGIYQLDIDGAAEAADFQVFDPAQVTVPSVGTTLPPFDTPTVADPRGVEPYCSRLEGPCPLHDLTLGPALAKRTPVAYMVGTPAHCQTGTCAPALEFLVEAHSRLGDKVAMVHADVYVDDTAKETTPAVQALGLDFEPVIFITDATGKIVERLDAIWDPTELNEALARVSA
jgi:hypothetical protein